MPFFGQNHLAFFLLLFGEIFSLCMASAGTYKHRDFKLSKNMKPTKNKCTQIFGWEEAEGNIELRIIPYELVCTFTEEPIMEHCANSTHPNIYKNSFCWPSQFFAADNKHGNLKPMFKTILPSSHNETNNFCDHHSNSTTTWNGLLAEISIYQANKTGNKFRKEIFVDVRIRFSYSQENIEFKQRVIEYDPDLTLKTNPLGATTEVALFTLKLFGDGITVPGFTTLLENVTGILHGCSAKVDFFRGINNGLEPICLVAFDMATTGKQLNLRYTQHRNCCKSISLYANEKLIDCRNEEPEKPKTAKQLKQEKEEEERRRELKIIMPEIRKLMNECLINPPPPVWPNVTNITGNDCVDDDEDSINWECDIDLTVEQAKVMLKDIKAECNNSLNEVQDDEHESSRVKKQAIVKRSNKWRSRIAYSFDEIEDGGNAEQRKQWCLKAMDKIQSLGTCIKFVKKDETDKDYIIFRYKPNCKKNCGCSASVGGPHVTTTGCWDTASLIHELGHTFGLHHEQDRSDRNKFVWAKNPSGKLTEKNSDNIGQPYDYGSIMHYNGYITLRRPYMNTQGAYDGVYSFKDRKMINYMYCNESCSGKLDRCQNGGYLNPKDCSRCLCSDGYSGSICQDVEKSDEICGSNVGNIFVSEKHKVYSLKFTLTGAGSCYWRFIPKSPMNRVNIVVKKLSGFRCNKGNRCGKESLEYLEIKYRADKTAAGARVCCIDDYEYNIDVVDGADILMILKGRGTHLEFQFDYQASGDIGLGPLTESCNCKSPLDLFIKKRNPDDMFYTYWYMKNVAKCIEEHGNAYPANYMHQTVDASCEPGNVTIILVNGKYNSHPKYTVISIYTGKEVPNESLIQIKCMKKLDGTSIWIYEDDDKTTGIIPVDEIMCLNKTLSGT